MVFQLSKRFPDAGKTCASKHKCSLHTLVNLAGLSPKSCLAYVQKPPAVSHARTTSRKNT